MFGKNRAMITLLKFQFREVMMIKNLMIYTGLLMVKLLVKTNTESTWSKVIQCLLFNPDRDRPGKKSG